MTYNAKRGGSLPKESVTSAKAALIGRPRIPDNGTIMVRYERSQGGTTVKLYDHPHLELPWAKSLIVQNHTPKAKL